MSELARNEEVIVFGRKARILREHRDKNYYIIVYTESTNRGRRRTHGMTEHKVIKRLVTTPSPVSHE